MIDPRYAIYFVPRADGAFYRFGSSMLGYDCYGGADVAHPGNAGLPDDWAELTQAPRRYGFHATLMAPFRLARDYDETALVQGLASFAERSRDITCIQPVVRTLGKFVAIVPRDGDAVLDRLAADCVTHFDRFRAPLSAADCARRLAPNLSERERANLRRWGYPYVFADFRFHMSLTGPLAADRRTGIVDLLSKRLSRCPGTEAVPIDRIVLLRQDTEESRFRVWREASLRSAETTPPLLTMPAE